MDQLVAGAGSGKLSEARRGPWLEKLKCCLGELNNFRVGNEKFQLSPYEFQSPLGSSCSVVRATVGLEVEASRIYNICPEVATQLQIADRMSKK